MINSCIEVSVYGEKNYKLFLEVIKHELDSSEYADITATQALILLNMRENVVTIGEVISRGYYVGSNASYNIRKLVSSGYIASGQSNYDKRTTLLKLTKKGFNLCDKVDKFLDMRMSLAEKKTRNKIDMKAGLDFMKRIETFWNDILRKRI